MAKFLGPSGVVLSQDPTSDLEATTKQYVDGLHTSPAVGQLVFSANNHGASQSFSGQTDIIWTDSIIYDPFGFWSSGSPTRITPSFAGTFRVYASINFPTNASGYRRIGIMRNGSDVRGGRARAADMTGGEVRINHEVEDDFDGSTDYITIETRVSGSYSGTFPNGGEASLIHFYYARPL